MRHQHLQGVADIRLTGDDAPFKALIKMLKQFVLMAVGNRAMIQIKALMAGQTFDLMLGYVQKDCGEPYYNTFVKAVSAQELADEVANYSAVQVAMPILPESLYRYPPRRRPQINDIEPMCCFCQVNPMAGKKVLTKANVFSEMFSFEYLYIVPAHWYSSY